MNINFDPETIAGFGEEWSKFDHSQREEEQLNEAFQNYFELFPWNNLSPLAQGFDLGCGSGRWAKFVAPKINRLYCIDASGKALQVAKQNLKAFTNCEFIEVSVENIPLDDDSMDFGYSLGVLHHIPDTAGGIQSCVKKLKKGAPFLLYLYYAFDNRPAWFRHLWRVSDVLRRYIAELPFNSRYILTQFIAFFVYYPLARLALLLENTGFNVDNFPLSAYRHKDFYFLRNDALDRFGTKLEKRFTKEEIKKMMEDAGLEKIEFSEVVFWGAVGYKK